MHMGIFFETLVNSCSYYLKSLFRDKILQKTACYRTCGGKIMPSIFNVLVCILALLVGVLIGEKYRKWKKDRDEKKDKK